MKKSAISTTQAALFTGVLIILMTGCNIFEGSGESTPKAQFSYEIMDRDGNIVAAVSHDQVQNQATERYASIFGDRFLPEWMIESGNLPPDVMNKLEIWLHAETGNNEMVQTLRFSFTELNEWKEGRFDFPAISEENWIQMMKLVWENRQHNLNAEPENHFKFISEKSQSGGSAAGANYYEARFATEYSYGLPIDSTKVKYQVASGFIDLEQVSIDFVNGNFLMDVLGLPMEVIYFSEIFPQEPELVFPVDVYRRDFFADRNL
jgi:hypothetical protein